MKKNENQKIRYKIFKLGYFTFYNIQVSQGRRIFAVPTQKVKKKKFFTVAVALDWFIRESDQKKKDPRKHLDIGDF